MIKSARDPESGTTSPTRYITFSLLSGDRRRAFHEGIASGQSCHQPTLRNFTRSSVIARRIAPPGGTRDPPHQNRTREGCSVPAKAGCRRPCCAANRSMASRIAALSSRGEEIPSPSETPGSAAPSADRRPRPVAHSDSSHYAGSGGSPLPDLSVFPPDRSDFQLSSRDRPNPLMADDARLCSRGGW